MCPFFNVSNPDNSQTARDIDMKFGTPVKQSQPFNRDLWFYGILNFFKKARKYITSIEELWYWIWWKSIEGFKYFQIFNFLRIFSVPLVRPMILKLLPNWVYSLSVNCYPSNLKKKKKKLAIFTEFVAEKYYRWGKFSSWNIRLSRGKDRPGVERESRIFTIVGKVGRRK